MTPTNWVRLAKPALYNKLTDTGTLSLGLAIIGGFERISSLLFSAGLEKKYVPTED